MPRIQGIDIPNDKKARIALTYLFGVGQTTADKMLADLNIGGDVKAKDLSDEELVRISDVTEGDLDRQLKTAVALTEPLMLLHQLCPSRSCE